jgi:hypothetical protein
MVSSSLSGIRCHNPQRQPLNLSIERVRKLLLDEVLLAKWNAYLRSTPQMGRTPDEEVTVGSEKYHIIFIDEGTVPKQMRQRVFEESQKAYRAAMRSAKFETHCLGVEFSIVASRGDGDCFFEVEYGCHARRERRQRERERRQPLQCTP